jgi:thiol-disulfide isomerase/thioredoxin
VLAATPAVTRLPAFQLADLDGKRRAIAEWADRALIINFWATWCAPCRKEMPLLQQVHMDRSGDGFTVIGVAIDRPDPVRAFVAETGVTYRILVGQQDAMAVAESFGPQVVGLPVSVFTAPGGEILKIHVGELEPGEITSILAEVDRVIRKEISVARARELLADT